jgi:hypothetical protein
MVHYVLAPYGESNCPRRPHVSVVLRLALAAAYRDQVAGGSGTHHLFRCSPRVCVMAGGADVSASV